PVHALLPHRSQPRPRDARRGPRPRAVATDHRGARRRDDGGERPRRRVDVPVRASFRLKHFFTAPTFPGKPPRLETSRSRRPVMRNGLALRRLQSIAVAAAALVALGRGRADEPAPLTKPPRLVRFIEAEAPPRLAELGRVDVILTIDIDAAGSVTAVAVAQSAGEDFDAAAVAAARQFAFEPGE